MRLALYASLFAIVECGSAAAIKPAKVEFPSLEKYAPLPKGWTAENFHPNEPVGEGRFAGQVKATPAPMLADEFRFMSHRMASTAEATTKVDQPPGQAAMSTSRVPDPVDPGAPPSPDKEPATLETQPAGYKPSAFDRFGASSVVRGNYLYVFGGAERGGEMPSNKLLMFDLDGKMWSVATTYGEAPPGRFFHSASLSPDGKKMYISGGTPCFSRIYQKSLDFDDANGQYNPMVQHATTMALSIEHSQGYDDVWAFSFENNEWMMLKASSLGREAECKAATNVYYNNDAARVKSSLAFFATAAVTLALMY